MRVLEVRKILLPLHTNHKFRICFLFLKIILTGDFKIKSSLVLVVLFSDLNMNEHCLYLQGLRCWGFPSYINSNKIISRPLLTNTLEGNCSRLGVSIRVFRFHNLPHFNHFLILLPLGLFTILILMCKAYSNPRIILFRN